MEDLDLDAFIADIEETAPQEEVDASRLVCQECGATLQSVDENYVCPDCGAQATNILQFEETELLYDEAGRAIVGQRVSTLDRRRKKEHSIDYGWGWSTDDAVVHILSLQITALERAGLVPEQFRESITNMWFKFWSENIAPFIKDEYAEDDLVVVEAKKVMKLRDIEVLLKFKDQVAIPARLCNQNKAARRRTFPYLGAVFSSEMPAESSDSYSSEHDSNDVEDDAKDEMPLQDGVAAIGDGPNQMEPVTGNGADEFDLKDNKTLGGNRSLSLDTITILTLNRTLAFIDATARVVCHEDPLTASDIIRACNHHLIPFYEAAKTLPDGMQLNIRDKLMFQVVRPPTPTQLSRTTSLLMNKIYSDRLPAELPAPNLNRLLKRFVTDMNLPTDLLELIRDKVTFSHFKQTKKFILTSNRRGVARLPQYDRWAYAILLCHLKNLFNLNDSSVAEQNRMAETNTSDRFFPIGDWLRQISLRVKLILRYDPYELFHPMADCYNFELTNQLSAYIDKILDSKATVSLRSQPQKLPYDAMFRDELTDFLIGELPKSVANQTLNKEELDASKEIKHPIKDALRRTERFWIEDVQQEPEISELIFKDFSDYKLISLDNVSQWCLFDESGVSDNRELYSDWPESFRLLVQVGAFLCLCEPDELLYEIRLVEMHFQPYSKVIKKRGLAMRQAQANSQRA